jgi:hypothetical protein
MAKASRRREASRSSGEESAGEEEHHPQRLDESTRREIEFKIAKRDGLLSEWISLHKEAESNLLEEVPPIHLLDEDREELQLCIKKIINGQVLEPIEIKTLVKTLGVGIDGNRLAFSVLAEKVGRRLEEAGIRLEGESSQMKVLDYLAQKEELFRKCPSGSKVSPCPVFELREMEIFRLDEELGGLYDKQIIRRKTMQVLNKLASYILALERARIDQKSLSLIDSCERKYTSAKVKLNQETVSKSELLGIQNKSKSSRDSTQQKEPKLAPNIHPSKEIPRKFNSFEQPIVRSSAFEEQNQRSGGQNAEQQSVILPNNTFITNFFNLKPKLPYAASLPVNSKPDDSVSLSVFKRNLGSMTVVAQWSRESRELFEKLFKPKTRSFKPAALSTLKQDLKQKIAAAKNRKSTIMVDEKTEAAQPRIVFIKFEDHLFYSYGFRGKFSKQSKQIGGRHPLVKDEEVIDYDLDSDEELEDLNGESIHSDDKDEEDEEDDLDPEDGFVVADGYFSDEELNGSFDEEERSKKILQEN